MDKIESLCKALRCIASFNGDGDCYREQHSKQRRTGEWAGTVCTSCGASVSNYYDCDYCPNCGSKNA